ncbi:MAG: STAS/SEC14 domain-containing protein [Leptolyngbya sp. SIO4C1]|nr:STAS/SEC14 domain-containing protein [Leptolyngbya sp. SIO4C1]
MIEYRNTLGSNIVELTVAGKITEADLDQVVAQLKVDIESQGKLRLLEEIRSFEGIDPIALWKDAQFGLQHVDDFTHVAVVAEAEWVRTIAAAADNLLSAKVKAFEQADLAAARTWLATAPDLSQVSGMTYTSDDVSNTVEIVVEGKITAADFDRIIPRIKADLAKHGKLKVLEEIRSFEGADPMALWKDLQQAYLIRDITHVALVADAQWMRTLAEAVGTIFPAEIKAFERSQLAEARIWLASR